jgi:hypothetical protein
MPRIRHWKELNLCRPPGEHRYLHIDSLFNTQAEWDLIAMMLPDMLTQLARFLHPVLISCGFAGAFSDYFRSIA